MHQEPSREPGVSLEIHFPIENTTSFESEKDDLHYVYSYVSRYLLLDALSLYGFSASTPLINHMAGNEFSGASQVIHGFGRSLFNEEFENIVSTDGWTIKHVEFIFSRCSTLCGDEPTYVHFALVTAFLSYIVSINFRDLYCFHSLYISEFCLDILYRRLFWKVFKSKEDYENLQEFCDNIFQNFIDDGDVITVNNNAIVKKWVNLVKHCFNVTEDKFSLKESEVILFQNCYSLGNHMEHKSAISRKIERELFPVRSTYGKELFCYTCKSKCYQYLEYAGMFIEN